MYHVSRNQENGKRIGNDIMAITTDVLYLNNIKVATPAENGISVGRHKTWSENSGRTESGKAIGTIKYLKYKLEIK